MFPSNMYDDIEDQAITYGEAYRQYALHALAPCLIT
jgi:hypothetical protein